MLTRESLSPSGGGEEERLEIGFLCRQGFRPTNLQYSRFKTRGCKKYFFFLATMSSGCRRRSVDPMKPYACAKSFRLFVCRISPPPFADRADDDSILFFFSKILLLSLLRFPREKKKSKLKTDSFPCWTFFLFSPPPKTVLVLLPRCRFTPLIPPPPWPVTHRRRRPYPFPRPLGFWVAGCPNIST